jgi:putative hydrolase
MTLVEGYAEHVMDGVGDQLDPAYADLRRRLERDRDRRGLLDQVVSKLLGLDMKMAQYRRGKAFADEVAGRAGIRALNRAWGNPEALPSMDELDAPEAWLERVRPRRRLLAGLLR